MKIIVALILLLLLPKAYAQHELRYDNNVVVCVDDISGLGYLNFFAWSGKQILDFLARGEFLKEREWKIIEKNPELALHLTTAANLARSISTSFCPEVSTYESRGVYGSDDEVDAIRHFVMSAYLALKVGKPTARKFMAAHEDSEFERSNMMDYYNNELGFNFGEKLKEKYKKRSIFDVGERLFINEIKKEISYRFKLPAGHPEDFLINTSGPSLCAKEKYR